MPDVERLQAELQRLTGLREDIDSRIEQIRAELSEAAGPIAADGTPLPPGARRRGHLWVLPTAAVAIAGWVRDYPVRAGIALGTAAAIGALAWWLLPSPAPDHVESPPRPTVAPSYSPSPSPSRSPSLPPEMLPTGTDSPGLGATPTEPPGPGPTGTPPEETPSPPPRSPEPPPKGDEPCVDLAGPRVDPDECEDDVRTVLSRLLDMIPLAAERSVERVFN